MIIIKACLHKRMLLQKGITNFQSRYRLCVEHIDKGTSSSTNRDSVCGFGCNWKLLQDMSSDREKKQKHYIRIGSVGDLCATPSWSSKTSTPTAVGCGIVSGTIAPWIAIAWPSPWIVSASCPCGAPLTATDSSSDPWTWIGSSFGPWTWIGFSCDPWIWICRDPLTWTCFSSALLIGTGFSSSPSIWICSSCAPLILTDFSCGLFAEMWSWPLWSPTRPNLTVDGCEIASAHFSPWNRIALPVPWTLTCFSCAP